MSARVFVHPRCWEGPASGALAAMMQERGYDLENLAVGPRTRAGNHEMVRRVSECDDVFVLERMDGVRFVHDAKSNAPAPEPEAA
jgi:hypothetical protein